MLTWLPFQIIIILTSSRLVIFVPVGIWQTVKFLQFSNSLVNVIIYPFRIPEFKGDLLRMLRGLVIAFSLKANRRSTEDVIETAI